MTGDRQSASTCANGASARAVIEDIQDAFRRGDYARIAARYDDEIDWLFHGPPGVFPEIGRRLGKVAVFKALEALNLHYRFVSHVTEWLVADDDHAASIADVTLMQRSSDRTIRCRVASFQRIRDGRVIEYRGFMDSFDAAEQVLGREFAL